MPLWGGCQKFLISSLQIMQNKAARYVTKKDVYTPIKELLVQCGWLGLHQLVFYHTVILFYKIRRNSTPTVLFDMAQADYPYSTRAKAKGSYKVLSSIRVPSSLAVQSFRWRSVQFWNMVPFEIKSTNSMVKFKKSLKLWITENIGMNP